MRKGIAIFAALVLLYAELVTAQNGNDLLQLAAKKVCEDRDFEGATQIYDQILRDFVSDRALASKALVQRGRAEELLALLQAQNSYEQVIKSHGNQPEAVAARVSLLSIGQSLLRKPAIFLADIDVRSGAIRGPASRLTPNCDIAEELPTWSPDAKHIAFRTDGDGGRSAGPNAYIVVQELETGQQRNFGRVSQAGPSLWFPDSKTLLSTGGEAGPSGLGAIVRIDVEQNVRTSVAEGLTLMPNTPASIGNGGFNVGRSVMSPDGTTLYSSIVTTGGDITSIALWAFDMAAGRQKGVFALPGAPVTPSPSTTLVSGPSHSVAINPDGRRIAVMRSGPMTSIAVMNADGGDYKEIVKDFGALVSVAWSNNRIFFGRAVGEISSAAQRPATLRNRIQIMQVPADGSSEPTFTGLEVDSLWSFDLSPDGSRIAFDGTDYRIFSNNPGAGTPRKPE